MQKIADDNAIIITIAIKIVYCRSLMISINIVISFCVMINYFRKFIKLMNIMNTFKIIIIIVISFGSSLFLIMKFILKAVQTHEQVFNRSKHFSLKTIFIIKFLIYPINQ